MDSTGKVLATVLTVLLGSSILSFAAQQKQPGTPPAPSINEAWSQLHTAAESKNIDTRIEAMTALSVLPANKEAAALLRSAFHDADIDVRIAAIIAAGETKNRNFSNELRAMLDDDSPQIAFVSALTLWKMGDHSGEDILVAVLNGDRKADQGFLKEGMHHANRSLHNPTKLIKEGALQTAGILLPPVGYGMGAYKYMRGTTQNPRVEALNEIAMEHNHFIRDQLIHAAADKDDEVRLAAAEGLAKYSGKPVTDALGELFGDSKTAVRLMACAAFIRASGPAPLVHTKQSR
ncbi:MAG: HEAT repeat domain-containing protein [Acidobacteria bacterium]|nr:HEAT repeat domain-containing protein [Acidobacteriota bacterium]